MVIFLYFLCKIPCYKIWEPQHDQVISNLYNIMRRVEKGCTVLVIPLFHTGPESHELTQIDKYLDLWLNRTQFAVVLSDSHSP